ncbi:DNA-binding protein [Streptomyces sp. NBC_00582]|uniref:DNA-binding protein n=1 Tax=Streptomyces sp. NBC_00582 TaxID=2975783 RepID=UPI002E822FB4|nr:DNA-binding protein [Streptomyces sp. NBC_00582]WUB60443.1 DNA-binding protein [Streptomyces sp. NBC_00582]
MTETRPTLTDIRKWPATVSVPKGAQALGCSPNHLHERIRRGDSPVKTLQFGKRHVVITADLLRVLSGEDREAV